MFGPKHYATDIAAQLVQGLRNGSITLEERKGKPDPIRVGLLEVLGRRDLLGVGAIAALILSLPARLIEKLAFRSDPLRIQVDDTARVFTPNQPGMVDADRGGELERSRKRLASSQSNSPNYWPAVLQLIEEQGQDSVDVRQLQKPILRFNLSAMPTHLIIEDQVVVLYGSGSLDTSTFYRCLVSISSITPPASFIDVKFVNCAFFSESIKEPTKSDKVFGEAYLSAKDVRDIHLSANFS